MFLRGTARVLDIRKKPAGEGQEKKNERLPVQINGYLLSREGDLQSYCLERFAMGAPAWPYIAPLHCAKFGVGYMDITTTQKHLLVIETDFATSTSKTLGQGCQSRMWPATNIFALRPIYRLTIIYTLWEKQLKTFFLKNMEDDTVRENGDTGTHSEVSCDNGRDESFSKHDTDG
ncbi:hypothetical protein TNCV_2846911 [Trichonephila clavipes]|nr:hypothetical protein TNCV_2846911 [Trichonephila clavipes]